MRRRLPPFPRWAALVFLLAFAAPSDAQFVPGENAGGKLDPPPEANGEDQPKVTRLITRGRGTLDDRVYYIRVPEPWLEHLEQRKARPADRHTVDDETDTTATADAGAGEQVKPPVMIVWLHPSGGNAQPEFAWLQIGRHGSMTGDFLLLNPQSAGKRWDLRKDGEFLSGLIDRAVRQFRLDPDRVLLAGHSSGAIFAYTYGLINQQRFFMILPAAGALQTRVPRAGHDAPLFHLYHSTNDTVIPFKHAEKAAESLRDFGYRVRITRDDKKHNVWTQTLDPLVDARRFLDRRYVPEDLDKSIAERLGGDAAVKTLYTARHWHATRTLDARPDRDNHADEDAPPMPDDLRAAGMTDRPSLKTQFKILDVLTAPATWDADAKPPHRFRPYQSLVAVSDAGRVTLTFDFGIRHMRVDVDDTQHGVTALSTEGRAAMNSLLKTALVGR